MCLSKRMLASAFSRHTQTYTHGLVLYIPDICGQTCYRRCCSSAGETVNRPNRMTIGQQCVHGNVAGTGNVCRGIVFGQGVVAVVATERQIQIQILHTTYTVAQDTLWMQIHTHSETGEYSHTCMHSKY